MWVLLCRTRSGREPTDNSASDTTLSKGHGTRLSPAFHLCKSQLCHQITGYMPLLPASETVTTPSRGRHSGRCNGCASGTAHALYTAAPFQQDSLGLQSLRLALLPSDTAKVPAQDCWAQTPGSNLQTASSTHTASECPRIQVIPLLGTPTCWPCLCTDPSFRTTASQPGNPGSSPRQSQGAPYFSLCPSSPQPPF